MPLPSSLGTVDFAAPPCFTASFARPLFSLSHCNRRLALSLSHGKLRLFATIAFSLAGCCSISVCQLDRTLPQPCLYDSTFSCRIFGRLCNLTRSMQVCGATNAKNRLILHLQAKAPAAARQPRG
eukprot:6133666-Pleurochrysis_carterae.AAC.1